MNVKNPLSLKKKSLKTFENFPKEIPKIRRKSENQ